MSEQKVKSPQTSGKQRRRTNRMSNNKSDKDFIVVSEFSERTGMFNVFFIDINIIFSYIDIC